NAAWQAIVEEIDDDRDTSGSGSNAPEHIVQQVFGIRGVNDCLYRRQADIPSADGWNTLYEGDGDAFFGKAFYQVSDAQGSVVSISAAAPMDIHGGPTLAAAQTIETLEYDPYGRPRYTDPVDFLHTGVADDTNWAAFYDAFFGGFGPPSPAADFND